MMNPTQILENHALVLTDGGLETDMIFNRGFELPAFAAHTLLDSERGREALKEYYRLFLELACENGAAFILDAPTWRAQSHFAGDLNTTAAALREANHAAVRFVDDIRSAYPRHAVDTILNAQIGPRGDAYAPEEWPSCAERAADYHFEQMSWLAETSLDMVTAMTFTTSTEVVGAVWAAQRAALPIAVAFTVETDGCLPNGESLEDAIQRTDEQTDSGALYFLVNCAHPDHLGQALKNRPLLKRIKGMRCNASRLSHAELDCMEELDRGDCGELATLYTHLKLRMPWVTIWGGCCGTDISHIAAIAHAIRPMSKTPVTNPARAAG